MVGRTESALRHVFRAFGPAIAGVSSMEAVRAGLGALIGLGVASLFILSPEVDFQLGLYLIAPFGATAVLLFAVPNSPLAQPWSAVVGNTLAAVVAVAVCQLVADPALRIALSVGLAITAMSIVRALHPPAGAVAMTAAMSPEAIHELGFYFAVAPVALGTAILVLIAMGYARVTGRRYPSWHFEGVNSHGTADSPPPERLGLSQEELVGILHRYQQSLNVGVEDLARLIGAAELQAASHTTGPLTADDIMSRNLVTVGPDTPLTEVADLFRRHEFTSLPVVQEDDKFLGMIFQIHLIRRAREDALRLDRSFGAAISRLLDQGRRTPVRASEIIAVGMPRATPTTPIGILLSLLARGGCVALPVLSRGRILGIVTQTDLIAALVRESLRNPRLATED